MYTQGVGFPETRDCYKYYDLLVAEAQLSVREKIGVQFSKATCDHI